MLRCDIYEQGKRCECNAQYEILYRGSHFGELKILEVCENHLEEKCEQLGNSIEEKYPLYVAS